MTTTLHVEDGGGGPQRVRGIICNSLRSDLYLAISRPNGDPREGGGGVPIGSNAASAVWITIIIPSILIMGYG